MTMISHKSGFPPLAAIFCAFLSFASMTSAGTYSGGSGTAEDPYTISTVADWQELIATSADWDESFILLNDINFGGITLTPVAPNTNPTTYDYYEGVPFSGVFNGNGHIVHNARIDPSNGNYIGLFGCLGDNGILRNFGIEDAIVSDVTTGGVLCALNRGKIINCHGIGLVSGHDRQLGCLVGWNEGTIQSSYSMGTVIGEELEEFSGSCGGLCGYNGGILSECYSTCAIIIHNSAYDIGGLCGHNSGTIFDCYATGSITGIIYSEYIGGLCGHNFGTIFRCYSTGSMPDAWSKDLNFGGLCGNNEGTITDSYWNRDTAKVPSSDGGWLLSDSQMMDADNYIGWNNGRWKINPGLDYPRLYWENSPGDWIVTDSPSRTYQGQGTDSDPYRLSTPEDLKCLGLRRSDWNQSFILAEDIDLSVFPNLRPIELFTGHLDGQGHTLSHFSCDMEVLGNRKQLGLVGCIGTGGVVENLQLTNVQIQGGDQPIYLGGLCGRNRGGTIRNCSVEGSIWGNDYSSYLGGLCGWNEGLIQECHFTGDILAGIEAFKLGGLCGYSSDGTILKCSATGTIHAGDSGRIFGILCGEIFRGTISHCSASGTVTGGSGSSGFGVLCGNNFEGNILLCYAIGMVSGGIPSDHLGGLCGNNGGSVRACYAKVGVSGEWCVGGLCGSNYGDIQECYAASPIVTPENAEDVGGLCGFNLNTTWEQGTIQGCFWDTEVSCQNSSSGGIGKTTAEMKHSATFLSEGWDFVDLDKGDRSGLWILSTNDYPLLIWQLHAPIVIPDCRGLSPAEASDRLAEAGFVVGDTILVYDLSLPVGRVLATLPASGSPGYHGVTVVDLRVSKDIHYSGGEGSVEDPYRISTTSDWRELVDDRGNWGGNFILTNDIDFQGVALVPVGGDYDYDPVSFRGVFEGNHHVLRNITLLYPDRDYVGLFGSLSDASEIRNLGMENIVVEGKDYVGGLCGDNRGGVLLNCSISATVTGSNGVGGLCGSNGGAITGCSASGIVSGEFAPQCLGILCGGNGGDISECTATGMVSGDDALGILCGCTALGTIFNCHSIGVITGWDGSGGIGGLVGESYQGRIVACSTWATMFCGSNSVLVGGLCGSNFGATMIDCFASSDVIVGNQPLYLGGLCGWNDGTIHGCYAAGTIDIGDNSVCVGGFCGKNFTGRIENCYATGKVTSRNGSEYLGGFCGMNGMDIVSSYSLVSVSQGDSSKSIGGFCGYNHENTIIDGCFWDIEFSGQNTSEGGIGKSTSEMKTMATFTGMGWDFGNAWAICEGTNYPRLKWQIPATDWMCPDGVTMEDLFFLAERWMAGTPEGVGAADVNGDGRVGIEDFAVMAGEWMKGL